MKKINEYTGKEYDCNCDYSYTCDECLAVREEFQKRIHDEEVRDWIVDSIERLANHLGVPLETFPKKGSKYD